MNHKQSKKQRTYASQHEIEGEVWKAIPGYEGLYEASSEGRIRSMYGHGTSEGRKSIISTGSYRIVKPLLQKAGYNAVCMYRPGEKVKLVKIHRLVASAFLGASNLLVNHKNGIKTDNRILNLEWCSNSENVKHALRVLKVKHQMSNKLSLTEVDKIKERLATGEYQREIAKSFGVRQSTISLIARGITWGEKTRNQISTGAARVRPSQGAYQGDEGPTMGMGY